MSVSAKVRQMVWDREDHCCAVCARPIRGAYSLQHRRARAMGGSRRPDTDTPVNLVLVDGTGTTGCHGYIESHPSWAQSMGYRVPQHADPATTPLWVARIGWVHLTPDGCYTPTSDPHPDETAVLEAAARVFLERTS